LLRCFTLMHILKKLLEQLPDERSPTLKSADHQALVTKLAQDRLRNPDALARDAISTLGFAEGSQEAFGIRYGLGVADLTQKQKSKLEFGARVASKRFQGPIRSVISDKYREAARGLERAIRFAKRCGNGRMKVSLKQLIRLVR
jgi:hypothetical protein